MRYLFIVLLNGFLMYPLFTIGQISPQQKRKVLFHVVEVLDQYERSMYIDDESNEAIFKSVFVSDSIMIFNDLLGFSPNKKIPLDTYMAIMKEKVKNLRINLKNVKIREIKEEDSKYKIVLDLEKNLNYSDSCGILFSNEEYYGKSYNLALYIDVNKDSFITKIVDIEGDIDSNLPKLKDGEYAVLKRTSDFDNEVLCNGLQVHFNSFDQAFIPVNSLFSHRDPDMRIFVEKKQPCNLVSLNYKLKSFNLRPYWEISIGDTFKGEHEQGGLNYSSSMTEFGVDFTYFFPRKSRTKWGLNIGLGYSKSKINLLMEDLHYHYEANGIEADVDGENYERYYDIKQVKQNVEMSNLVLPISVEMETKFGRIFSCFAEFGLKNYFNLSGKTTDFSLDQNVYGVFRGYGDPIIFDKPNYWGYNGFGPSTLGKENFQDGAEVKMKSFTSDIFAGIGCSFNIWHNFSLKMGFKYQMGFMDVLETDEAMVSDLSSEEVTSSSALVNYTLLQGEKTKSLISSLGKLKRGTFLVNVGLNFKF